MNIRNVLSKTLFLSVIIMPLMANASDINFTDGETVYTCSYTGIEVQSDGTTKITLSDLTCFLGETETEITETGT